ncbi:rod shape-determining protein MreD [Paenibacillus aurantius]|uniref:Rod shape-determining protein MreD n=1 Tax=Paenibacillus aurantius TaxID=2918900 RepID=A0AA96RH46_9BACL|nr:rod shape-determining protein MreD [Paenibacillus aurantius]WJH32544.1 rod shape-determining protein MreD [Paenibacillus sp. CC-CFT747]WNQ12973.1 rod shape-determining protein MreD [Paenibacillus aurantius]
MNRNRLTLVLFVLFLIEGTWLKWIIPPEWQENVIVAPHLLLTAVLLIGIYVNRHTALLYGAGFGLLHDIVYYGPMIGPYCLCMGLLGYAAGLISFRSYSSILTSMFLVTVGNFAFEWLIYGIYRVFQVIHTDVNRIFLYQMLPSILINLLFALVIYVPMRRLLEKVKAGVRTEDYNGDV